MTIRAIIFLADGTTRSNDYATEADATAWLDQVASAQTYGDPSSYVTDLVDVTAELQALADEADGAAARKLGSRVIDRLRNVNLKKGFAAQDLINIASDPEMVLAKTFLDTGAPELAKGKILANGPRWGYTADELTIILAPLTPPKPPTPPTAPTPAPEPTPSETPADAPAAESTGA